MTRRSSSLIQLLTLALAGCAALAAVLLSACAHDRNTTRPPAIAADPSLLLPWSEERQPSAPCAVTYQRNGRRLVYVAAFHETTVSGRTHELVRTAFEELRPQLVVAEGFPSDLGRSPPKQGEGARAVCESGSELCDESRYAVWLASKRGATFIGGEPSIRAQWEALVHAGYTAQDVFGYYIGRQVSQWKREGLAAAGFESSLTRMADALRTRVDWKGADLSAAGFRSWYRARQGHEFDFAAIDPNTSAPIERGTFLQRLSYQDGIARNVNVVEQIAEGLRSFERVLVVYGAGHYAEQERVLEAMMGPPVASTCVRGRTR